MSTRLTPDTLAEYGKRFYEWHGPSDDDCAVCVVKKLLDHCTALEDEIYIGEHRFPDQTWKARCMEQHARITALEEELKKSQSELAEAAREIICAGPVSHRIRVLKREHEEELKAAQAEIDRLRGLVGHMNLPLGDWDHDSERHRLRKRRMLVCSVCQQGYFNQQEFDEHECWSAY